MMKKLLLILFAVLLMIPFAAAGNIETNYFYEKGTLKAMDNVQMLLYTCADEQCNYVIQPPAADVNSGDNNYITVEYPGTAYPTDYAEYFYAEGYLPMEFVIPNDWGTGGVYAYNVYFEKAKECHAPIYEFNIQNTVYANEPLQINVLAKLDANTYSAFRDAGIPPFYVPEAYKENYYSALTEVTLKIKELGGAVVYEESNTINIYMDTEEHVEFFWTPTEAKQYLVEISTDVIDDQCESSFEQKTSQQITVLPSRPADEYYVLLNGLTANNPYPKVYEEITFAYSKISNYADSNHAKTAVPMKATYTIIKGDSNADEPVVMRITEDVPATSTDVPAMQSFKWTPEETGQYTVYVHGICDVETSKPNHDETVSMEFYVEPQTANDIIFTVTELNSDPANPVQNADVTIGADSSQTNSQGIAILEDFAPGTYIYTISHPDYKSLTGSVQVGLQTVYVYAQLEKTGNSGDDNNTAPAFTTVPITTAVKGELYRYNANAVDEEEDEITYSLAFAPPAMEINANGVVTWTPESTGEFDVSIKAEDVHGDYALQTYTIKVTEKQGSIMQIENLAVSRIQMSDEYAMPGEQLVISMSLGNTGTEKLEDVKITASVYELGARQSTGYTTIKRSDEITKTLFLEMPYDAMPGNYAARIEIYNGDLKRVIYRDFFIE